MFFIGYSTPKELIDNLPPALKFYVDLVTEPGKTNKHGMRSDRMVLILSALPAHDNNCHYWQMTVATKTDMAGQALEQNANERYQAAQEAARLLEDWLTEQGITRVVHAMVARPLEYRFLDGSCDFMRFDKEQYTWVRCDFVRV